jgi:hypothetical protein
VSWSRGSEPDAETLLARADHAMYDVKRARSTGRPTAAHA